MAATPQTQRQTAPRCFNRKGRSLRSRDEAAHQPLHHAHVGVWNIRGEGINRSGLYVDWMDISSQRLILNRRKVICAAGCLSNRVSAEILLQEAADLTRSHKQRDVSSRRGFSRPAKCGEAILRRRLLCSSQFASRHLCSAV